MRKLHFTIAVLLTGLFVVFNSSPLASFCIIRSSGWRDGQTNCCSGNIRWWHPNTLPVPITINRKGSKQAHGEATANAIRRAMQTWNNVESAFFQFSDAGLTDQDFSANDGTNIIVFDVEGNNFVEGTTVLAFSRTLTITDDLGYRAYDSDMVFNARDYEWNVDRSQNAFDIETVALHELGHHLGLDHPGGGRDISSASSGCGPVVQQAVMYYAVGQGTAKRKLYEDDIAGITQMYPNWTIEGTVVDAATGLPIPNAEIYLNGTAVPRDTISVSAIHTDSDGKFFAPVPDDSFSISIPTFGYEYVAPITVFFDQPEEKSFNFFIEPLETSTIQGWVKDSESGQSIFASVELYVGDSVCFVSELSESF